MLPNILTTVRLFLIPIFAYAFLGMKNIWLAAAIFLLSGLTDVIDGWIARHFNMITDIGKVYDPLVDKLMQITSVVCLAIANIIPDWVIWFVVMKEAAMILTSSVLYAKKIVVHSNWYGKSATVFFYAVIIIMIVFPDINYIVKTTLLVMLVAVVLAAAFGYLIKAIVPGEEKIYEKKLD